MLVHGLLICKKFKLIDSSATAQFAKTLFNSTKKWQHYFDILKVFFVRHASEYKTLVSDRKVNRNIYPDAVTRDRMRLIDPQEGF